jgi:hypothetical protein
MNNTLGGANKRLSALGNILSFIGIFSICMLNAGEPLGESNVKEELINALWPLKLEKNRDKIKNTLAALTDKNKSEVIKTLSDLIEADLPEAEDALIALALIGREHKSAVVAIEKFLLGRSFKISKGALAALAYVGPPASTATSAIITAVKANEDLWMQAVETLSRLGLIIVPDLLNCVCKEEIKIKLLCILSIGRMKDTIENVVFKEDDAVKFAPVLIELLLEPKKIIFTLPSDDTAVRATIIHILEQLNVSDSDVIAAIEKSGIMNENLRDVSNNAVKKIKERIRKKQD